MLWAHVTSTALFQHHCMVDILSHGACQEYILLQHHCMVDVLSHGACREYILLQHHCMVDVLSQGGHMSQSPPCCNTTACRHVF